MGSTEQSWLKTYHITIIVIIAIWSIACYSLLWSYTHLSTVYLFDGSDNLLKSNLYHKNDGPLQENNSSLLETQGEILDIIIDTENTSKGQALINALNRTVGAEIIPLENISSRRPSIPMYIDPLISINNLVDKTTRNFPLKFLDQHDSKSIHINSTCANLPAFYDINFNNIYWQYFDTTNGTFYLYSSFYDVRNEQKSFIRIIGMIDKMDPTVKTYCQFWFDGSSKPVISEVFEYNYIWVKGWGNNKDGILQPYVMSCELAEVEKSKVPIAVSIVEHFCDTPKNIIKVIGRLGQPVTKKEFAVCVKPFDYLYEDISIRLVEWLEVIFALGADKIFIYVLEVHPNVLKVIEYYERLGKLDVTPLTLPAQLPNLPNIIHKYLKAKVTNKRQNEVIPYNDCYYRNIYDYKYVALLDIDEIIMPRKETSWKDLVNSTHEKYDTFTKASLCARNIYFFYEEAKTKECDDLIHDIPCYLHFLRHTIRSANYTKPGYYVKCFHSTDGILALHNHYPLSCLGSCNTYSFNTEDAHLQHYRRDCVAELKKSCQSNFKDHTVEDKSIIRFKEHLLQIIPDIISELGLLLNY